MDAISEPAEPARFPSETARLPAIRLDAHHALDLGDRLFFLLLSGLQIFNAHPTLYVGEQSGFGFNNEVLAIGAENTEDGPRGYTECSANASTQPACSACPAARSTARRGFPAWATIPSYQDLATGRVVHFFFAWVLVGTLSDGWSASLINGHFGASWCRRSPTSAACRATSPITRG